MFKTYPTDSDGGVCSEIVIRADKVGPFSANLQCLLEQSSESLSMLVQGSVQVQSSYVHTCS